MALRASRSRTRRPLPLALVRRRRRLRLAERPRPRPARGPGRATTSCSRSIRARPHGTCGSVVYEIFPDRFASSGAQRDPPDWAVRRGWDELPEGRGRNTCTSGSAATSPGIEQHLDHVEALGANVIYLTPFFPAGSTHRYDSSSFDRVDPLLGGDEALASLARAAHARGMRVIADLTMNHIGRQHEWFERGERELYLFDESGDSSTLAIKSLPGYATGSRPSCRSSLALAELTAHARRLRRWLDAGSTAGASTSRT